MDFRKIFIAVVAVFLVLIMVSCQRTFSKSNEAQPPKSSQMIGEHYEDVFKMFETEGFTNIELVRLDNLKLGILSKENAVESVYVGGNKRYDHKKWYPKDVEVRINYHSFPESNDKAK